MIENHVVKPLGLTPTAPRELTADQGRKSTRKLTPRQRQQINAQKRQLLAAGVDIEPAVCEFCGVGYWRRVGGDQRYCKAGCRTQASRARKRATVAAFASYIGRDVGTIADIADRSTLALKGMQVFLAERGLRYEPARRAWGLSPQHSSLYEFHETSMKGAC